MREDCSSVIENVPVRKDVDALLLLPLKEHAKSEIKRREKNVEETSDS